MRTESLVSEECMDAVHVFISTDRFRSFEELRAFIDQTYTEDGDGVPSAFMGEVGLSGYEPGCIEAIVSESGKAIPLAELLAGMSYSDRWLTGVGGSRLADAAICVFAPNELRNPEGSSLEYIGAFRFRAAHSE
jgi:hypothetical protein